MKYAMLLKKFLYPEYYYSILRRDWQISTFVIDFFLKMLAVIVVSIDRFIKNTSVISASALTFYSMLAFIPVVALVLATVNVVGGYVVTDRMLAMFKKKEDK